MSEPAGNHSSAKFSLQESMQTNFYTDLNDEQKQKWKNFWLNCHHSHFRQSYVLGEIEKAKGRKPIYVCGEINGNLVCIAIFTIRPHFINDRFSFEAVCLRGPAFDDVEYGYAFLTKVISWCKTMNIGRLRISPHWFYPEAETVESLLRELNFIPVNGRHRSPTGLVDLKRSNAEILSSFSKKTRKQIRIADQLGVTIRPAEHYSEAQEACSCLNNMRKERGITQMSEKEFHATYEHILKYQEQGILFIAKAGPIFLGARWSINSPNIAHGAGYAINPLNLKLLSANLTIGLPLYWEAFQWSKNKGCEWFDLEGAVDIEDPNDPIYNISQFKQHFKPMAIDKINEHYFICDKSMYMFYKGINLMNKAARFVTSMPYQMKRRS